jgi:hypothetical protein
MLQSKPIVNKFYLHGGKIVKIKKVQKKREIILAEYQDDFSLIELPLAGFDILLSRIYTIGEVSKIVNRRADTIRKYEKSGLISSPIKVDDIYKNLKNWRLYRESDVYEMVEFFASRSPGRPAKPAPVKERITKLNQKVKITPSVKTRSLYEQSKG